MTERASDSKALEKNMTKPVRAVIALGAKGLRYNKVKTAIAMWITIVTITVFAVGQALVGFSMDKMTVRSCLRAGWDYIEVTVRDTDDKTSPKQSEIMSMAKQAGVLYVPTDGKVGYLDGAVQEDESGFAFYQAEELSKNGAYLSDRALENMYKESQADDESMQYRVWEGDRYELLTKESYPYERLVGKTIVQGDPQKHWWKEEDAFVVNGVYRSIYYDYFEADGTPKTAAQTGSDAVLIEAIQSRIDRFTPERLLRIDSSVAWSEWSPSGSREGISVSNGGQVNAMLTIKPESHFQRAEMVTAEGTVRFGRNASDADVGSYVRLETNEIVLTGELYRQLFPDDLIYDGSRTPYHLGETVYLNTAEGTVSLGLRGVSFTEDAVAVHRGVYEGLSEQGKSCFKSGAHGLLVLQDNRGEAERFLHALDVAMGGNATYSVWKEGPLLSSPFAGVLEYHANEAEEIGLIMMLVSVLGLVLSFLLMLDLFTAMSKAWGREVPFPHGADNRKRVWIGVVHALFVALIVAAVSLIAVYGITLILNLAAIRTTGFASLLVLMPSVWTVLLTVGLSLVVAGLGVAFPLRKASKCREA